MMCMHSSYNGLHGIVVHVIVDLAHQKIILRLPEPYPCGDWGLAMRLNQSRLRDSSAIVLIALLQAYI